MAYEAVPDTSAPKTVNRQDGGGCCGWGGRNSRYAHDVCECCCGKFNCSTFLCSVCCPCYVFYRTAEELNARKSQMAGEPSCLTTSAWLTGLITAINPISSCFAGGSTAGTVTPAVAKSAVEGASVVAVGSCCDTLATIGMWINFAVTCHFGYELGKITTISEDCCTQCLCSFCCTPCRMTQIYHTLTDDDVGCICCCNPAKSKNAME